MRDAKSDNNAATYKNTVKYSNSGNKTNAKKQPNIFCIISESRNTDLH